MSPQSVWKEANLIVVSSWNYFNPGLIIIIIIIVFIHTDKYTYPMLHFVKIDNYDNTKNNWNWKGLYTYYTKLYLKINLFTKVDLKRSVKILG